MWQKISVKIGISMFQWLRENIAVVLLIIAVMLYTFLEDSTDELFGSDASTNEYMMTRQVEGVNKWNILWPTPKNYDISSPYGMRIDPFTGKLAFHTGIDIPGSFGDPIQATQNGKVIRIEEEAKGNGYGNVIYIEHKIGRDTFTTVYAHLLNILVEEGQTVEQGERIGTIGSSGRSTGPHLHFEIRQKDKYLDPFKMSYLYSLFAKKLVPEGDKLIEELVQQIQAGLGPNQALVGYEAWFGLQVIDSNMSKVVFHNRVKVWGKFEIETCTPTGGGGGGGEGEGSEDGGEGNGDGASGESGDEEGSSGDEAGNDEGESGGGGSISCSIETVEAQLEKDYFMTFGKKEALFTNDWR
ncbi:hypothetical protein BHU72_14720 [Desulfuribacillus stibiiarsenatis]|uniref:M23ase beta-sheet core domain-containing protein n=1 Tax=Desulfuribacillus stibiiarsenatis TaxID=1390249 RepID=A0A1E5L7T1_9FIRM|nr:M23 family metallopeptidase [Desulfuribacillus stibiiarsenatis]OEH86003.1 hypothetical protein BHU72_14720 [Desulfuribacillus stibiiarsenatis]